jgi:hypothetical protein
LPSIRKIRNFRVSPRFRTWAYARKQPPRKAEAALERIKAAAGPFRDLTDIVERALAVSKKQRQRHFRRKTIRG